VDILLIRRNIRVMIMMMMMISVKSDNQLWNDVVMNNV